MKTFVFARETINALLIFILIIWCIFTVSCINKFSRYGLKRIYFVSHKANVLDLMSEIIYDEKIRFYVISKDISHDNLKKLINEISVDIRIEKNISIVMIENNTEYFQDHGSYVVVKDEKYLSLKSFHKKHTIAWIKRKNNKTNYEILKRSK